MNLKPYIGVTGFTSQGQIKEALKVFPESSTRLLMAGVLASTKTLVGFPFDHPKRYPTREDMPRIFFDHPLVLNLVHYYLPELPAGMVEDNLYGHLDLMTNIAGPFCHGLQLNMIWPSPAQLGKYRSNHPEKKIVLQISKKSFDLVDQSPLRLAIRLVAEYSGLVDYILLDFSRGKGISLDPPLMRRCLDAIVSRQNFKVGLAVAGGLGPDSLDLIRRLINLPNISFDAQGKLRDSEDNLDPQAVQLYERKSLEMCGIKPVQF